jgi:L-asparaginase/Glu-tRNA(Gln) amidotransferase subunit D
MSPGMREGLHRSAGRKIPIVVTSRVPGGRIVGRPEYDFPAIVARDLPDNKARLLLMLALTRTQDPAELQRIFDTY